MQLHLLLIRSFPEEAGLKPDCARILPELPAQQMFVSFTMAKSRVEELDRYLQELTHLDKKISSSKIVREFLKGEVKGADGLVRVDSQPQVPNRRTGRHVRDDSSSSV